MEIGRIIGGRYQIVRKVAEGGMGAVFEAQHTLSKKTIALKILFPHIGKDEASRQRFMREVSAPAQIGHDGIVEVYDAGFDTQDGSLFVAMEMLQGETLRDRLARGGHSRDQVLDFFEEMLEPLAAAHDKGIVHRDLKPENVYLHKQRDGREVLKLLDFGIARDLDEKSQSVTQTGMAMGTPHYMAPEQAMSARGVSYPADIWAVGAMMYEALSGKTPFSGETASAIVVYAVSQPHEPLAKAAPATPPALAELVDRCLSKEADKRPRNGRDLLLQLRTARGKSPGLGGPLAATASPHAITAQVAPNAPAGMMPTAAPGLASSPVPTPAGPSLGPITSGYGTAPGMSSASGGHNTPTPPTNAYGAPTPAPGAYGTPTPGAYGTPAPAYGTPAPGYATAPPTAKRSSGGFGRVLLVVGVVAVFGLMGVVGVVGIGAFAAGNAMTASTGSSGTVRLMTVIPGQLFVDGALIGPVMIGGQDVPLSAGAHTIEIRNAGATLSSANVEVSAGQVQQIELARGMFAGAGIAGAGTAPPTGGPQVLTGTLAPGDTTLNSGEYVDSYDFNWTAGQHVHIELSSSAFDTYVILRFPSGRQRDNDDANGTDAMLDQTVDETGTYRVMATSYQAAVTGPYTLTVR